MTAPVTQGGPEKFRRWSIAITSQDLPEFVTKAHREIHADVITAMILGTPVGNPDLWKSPPPKGYVGGRARSNWQSSTLSPQAGEPNGPNAQSYPGAGEVQEMNRSAAQSVRPYSRIFVTNNTPYINVLNNGVHSKQAPRQWMETALDRVKARFESGGA